MRVRGGGNDLIQKLLKLRSTPLLVFHRPAARLNDVSSTYVPRGECVRGVLAQGLGIRLFAFGSAYWPLALCTF